MAQIFDLSPNLTLLPVLHGSGDFSLEVRRRILDASYDCLAVPLPPAFEEGVEEAIERLPSVHIVAQREGGPNDEADSYTYVPIDPCQPVIAGIRAATEKDIPRAFIDLEVDRYVEQSTMLPDPYALKEVPLEKFSAAVLTGLPAPEDQHLERISWMAYQLHLLELEYENILFLCSVADWPWVRDAYTRRLDYPNASPSVWPPEIYRVAPKTLYFVMGELPFVTALYEHRRSELLPDRTLAIDGIKALLLEARAAWVKKHDLKQHWLTPQIFSLMLRYIRNLTLMDRRMSPDLYTLALAAKQIAGDDFAITLLETARTYPPQSIPSLFPEVPVGLDRIPFPTGDTQTKNRLKGITTEWLHHRGDAGSMNYSALDLINRDNIDRLEVSWRWKSDNFGPVPWANLQTTPILANGILYATAGERRVVVAIDGESGETLWMYRIDEGERGDYAPRKGPGRGVAFYRGVDRETVFLISPGYHLIAIDAATGRPQQSFGDNGIVDLKLQIGQDLNPVTSPIASSSPPMVRACSSSRGRVVAFSSVTSALSRSASSATDRSR